MHVSALDVLGLCSPSEHLGAWMQRAFWHLTEIFYCHLKKSEISYRKICGLFDLGSTLGCNVLFTPFRK